MRSDRYEGTATAMTMAHTGRRADVHVPYRALQPHEKDTGSPTERPAKDTHWLFTSKENKVVLII